MKTITLIALALLSGCATIERHPVITSTLVAVAATSIALSVGHDGAQPHPFPVARHH